MKRLLFMVIISVILVQAVAAEQMLLFSFSYKGNPNDSAMSIKLSDINKISSYTAPGEATDTQYQLVDENNQILHAGSFTLAKDLFYDKYSKKLTGGMVTKEDGNFAVVTPLYNNIKYIRLQKDSQLLFEEDLSTSAQYRNAVGAGSLDSGCVTVRSTGDPASKLNIVFLGQNYQSQMPTFISNVMDVQNYFLSIEPWNSNRNRFNIYYVDQSLDLGCYSNCGNNPSLICCDTGRVIQGASQCPFNSQKDKAIVLANNFPSGGGASLGGVWAATSNDAFMREGAAHEFGHAFGYLMDEYDYGASGPARPSFAVPNCDIQPCNRWSGVPGTGCIQVCGFNNHFRSIDNSLMRSLIGVNSYGQVSTTNMTWRLSRFNDNIPPTITSTPVTVAYREQSYTYQVTAVDPNNDPLTFRLEQESPVRMTINPNSGLITWNPVVSESRAPIVNITVSDGRGGIATQRYLIRLL